KHFAQEQANRTFGHIKRDMKEYRAVSYFLYPLQGSGIFVIHHHLQQMEWLEYIIRNFTAGLPYPVDQVGLHSEFFGKYLRNDATAFIAGRFKYDSPGFVKHTEKMEWLCRD